MALAFNPVTKVITIHQSDLTLVTGTLYELDTEAVFRAQVNAWLASEYGMYSVDVIDHSSEYTVAGVTYARKIEVINGWSVTFDPDAQWTVRLAGSNNNLFDVENGILNQNQVSVIGQNAAGLVTQPILNKDALTLKQYLALKT